MTQQVIGLWLFLPASSLFSSASALWPLTKGQPKATVSSIQSPGEPKCIKTISEQLPTISEHIFGNAIWYRLDQCFSDSERLIIELKSNTFYGAVI